jgi:hypothetical protein
MFLLQRRKNLLHHHHRRLPLHPRKKERKLPPQGIKGSKSAHQQLYSDNLPRSISRDTTRRAPIKAAADILPDKVADTLPDSIQVSMQVQGLPRIHRGLAQRPITVDPDFLHPEQDPPTLLEEGLLILLGQDPPTLLGEDLLIHLVVSLMDQGLPATVPQAQFLPKTPHPVSMKAEKRKGEKSSRTRAKRLLAKLERRRNSANINLRRSMKSVLLTLEIDKAFEIPMNRCGEKDALRKRCALSKKR